MVAHLTHENVLQLLPDRQPDSYKGDYGKILLLCGSRGYTGAAYLAAMGALRSGAGLVYLGVPESIYEIEAVKLNEPIVFPLCEESGMYAVEACDQLGDLNGRYDAILIGPGIGKSAGTLALTAYVLQSFHGPVVVDADGINVLVEHKNILRGRAYPTILTPHDGEFARICGESLPDRVAAAKALACDLQSIVLRKGHSTVITDGSKTYINSTGNAGMATGGSGDVLAGILVSLLGQGIPPVQAAACAAWLHGAAGDICAEAMGQYGMLPSDMLTVLPRLVK